MRATLARLLGSCVVAGVVLEGALLVRPPIALACQAPPVAFEERLEAATLIVHGVVTERRFPGGSGYDVVVREVFRGDNVPEILSIGAPVIQALYRRVDIRFRLATRWSSRSYPRMTSRT